jgi:hypothetical protein
VPVQSAGEHDVGGPIQPFLRLARLERLSRLGFLGLSLRDEGLTRGRLLIVCEAVGRGERQARDEDQGTATLHDGPNVIGDTVRPVSCDLFQT